MIADTADLADFDARRTTLPPAPSRWRLALAWIVSTWNGEQSGVVLRAVAMVLSLVTLLLTAIAITALVFTW